MVMVCEFIGKNHLNQAVELGIKIVKNLEHHQILVQMDHKVTKVHKVDRVIKVQLELKVQKDLRVI